METEERPRILKRVGRRVRNKVQAVAARAEIVLIEVSETDEHADDAQIVAIEETVHIVVG